MMRRLIACSLAALLAFLPLESLAVLKGVAAASGLQNAAAVAITGGTLSGVTISSTLNGLTTAGQTLPIIVARGRSVAQAAAVASVAAFTVGAAVASFEVSANMLITASTTFSIFIQCTYTDEGNTSRTMTLPLLPLGGVAATNAGNAAGTVPYSTAVQTIRAKTGTVITMLTSGTFTTVTYNVEAIIKQVATT